MLQHPNTRGASWKSWSGNVVGTSRFWPYGARNISTAAVAVGWPGRTPNASAVSFARLITPSAQTEAPSHMSQL